MRNAYAALFYKTKRYEAARALYEKSLETARQGNNKLHLATIMEGLARVVAAEGELAWAGQLWGAAAALREKIAVLLLPSERADYERAVTAARSALGEDAFAIAWTQGRAMTPDQALTPR